MIYIIAGAPGAGKSYYGTKIAVDEMIKGGKRVITNYPVIHVIPLTRIEKFLNLYIKIRNKLPYIKKIDKFKTEKVLSSYMWRPEYIELGLSNCLVVLDEAYRYFSSRNFKDFKVNSHLFFATNRHDENYFYLIAQHPNRLDVIIRELANYILYVKKLSPFWSHTPLLFTIYGYLNDMSDSLSDENIEFKTYCIPKSYVKKAYDTHYYKHQENEVTYKTWLEDMNEKQGLEASKIKPVNLAVSQVKA